MIHRAVTSTDTTSVTNSIIAKIAINNTMAIDRVKTSTFLNLEIRTAAISVNLVA